MSHRKIFNTLVRGWKTVFVAFLLACPIGLTACEKEGPAEKAGEKVDEAVEKNGRPTGKSR